MKNIERILPPIVNFGKKFKGSPNYIFSIVVLFVLWGACFWLFKYGSIYGWTIIPTIVTSLGIIARVTIWWLYHDDEGYKKGGTLE